MSVAIRSAERELRLRVLRSIRAHAPFRRMMSRQGIDLTGSWWRGFEEMIFRALRQCAACPRSEICQAWLEQEDPQQRYPAFCPNGAIIEACRIMDPNARCLFPNDDC